VYVHGLVRDGHGQKMSKSKGNILDPLDLVEGIDLESLIRKRTTGLMQPKMAPRIEKATRLEFPTGIEAFGTDALRFTFASLASTGRNINFDLGRIEGYRNFCNKLWNAARFVLMNTVGQDCGQHGGELEYSLADRWIISRLQLVEDQVEQAVKDYRLDNMANALYAFVWDEFCSWYLELTKVVLNSDQASDAMHRSSRRSLVRVLEATLRLLHPITPFITEEIWQQVTPLCGKHGDTIMIQPYPRSDAEKIDHAALREMQWVQSIIGAVRNIRGDRNIEPGRKLPVLLQGGDDQDCAFLERNRDYLLQLGRFQSVDKISGEQRIPQSAMSLVGQLKVLVPLGEVIDKQTELERLTKELEKFHKELMRSNGKLENPRFIDKAPKQVVDKERQRVTEINLAIDKLKTQLEEVRGLP
jgi:valyl-tRNA synthetase